MTQNEQARQSTIDDVLQPTVLWLLVVYNNMAEVDSYIDHLDLLRETPESYLYAVCDNSPAPGESRHSSRSDVIFTSRPDNPGYLDGAITALRSANESGWPGASWTALSNTDLRWVSEDPSGILSQHKNELPAVIAPRITEGAEAAEKNPHVLSRRSLRRLRFNAWVAASPAIMMCYQVAALIRIRLGRGEKASRLDAESWSAAHPQGLRFYSPYGAVMFFSSGFEPSNNLPEGIPLYAEEYFIAEAALEVGAPVVYEPRIHAHHDAHTTTGPKVAWGRAKGTRGAFTAIRSHARMVRDM